MNDNLETKVNAAAQQNDQSLRSAQAPPGRASRPGRFSHLLKNISIIKDIHPKALVRSGRSVTFSGVAFFDQFGNRIDPDNPSSLKRTEEGHRGRRPQRTDSHLNREMALSENQGTAVFVPGFKKRAAEHLLLTDQLRMQILSGEVETPGNQSDVLKKRLGVELKAEEDHDPQMWLQEFSSHMASTPEGDAALLVAQAAAVTNGEKQMQRARSEMKNPLEKDVQPFAPPRISMPGKSHQSRNGESKSAKGIADSTPANSKPKTISRMPNLSTTSGKLPDFKSEVGEKPSLDVPEKKPQSVRVELNQKPNGNLLTQLRSKVGSARSQAWSDARIVRENDGELRVASLTTPKAVPRVTVERSTEIAADLNKPSVGQETPQRTRASRPATRPETILTDRSHTASARHVESHVAEEATVTAQRSAASQDSGKASAGGAAIRGEARSRVASMERSGWHVHMPNTNNSKSSETRVGRPTSANSVKPSISGSERTARKPVQSKEQSKTGRNKKSIASDDTSAIKPGAAKGSIVSNLVSNLVSAKGRRTSSSAQGLQNLSEVMQKISSQAKVLKGDGIIKLQVPMKPAKLGNMLLSVIRDNGKYIVKLIAERQDAHKTLERHLPAIRQHLANQGINVERIEVENGDARPTDSIGEQQRREAAERKQERQRNLNGNRRTQSDRGNSDPHNDTRTGPLRTGLNTVEYLAE